MRRIVSFWDVLPLYETHRCLTIYIIISILLMRGRMDTFCRGSESLELQGRLDRVMPLRHALVVQAEGERLSLRHLVSRTGIIRRNNNVWFDWKDSREDC